MNFDPEAHLLELVTKNPGFYSPFNLVREFMRYYMSSDLKCPELKDAKYFVEKTIRNNKIQTRKDEKMFSFDNRCYPEGSQIF